MEQTIHRFVLNPGV